MIRFAGTILVEITPIKMKQKTLGCECDLFKKKKKNECTHTQSNEFHISELLKL